MNHAMYVLIASHDVGETFFCVIGLLVLGAIALAIANVMTEPSQPASPPVPQTTEERLQEKQAEIERARERLNAMEAEYIAMLQSERNEG